MEGWIDDVLEAVDGALEADAAKAGMEHPSTWYEMVDAGEEHGMKYLKFRVDGDWKHDHLYFEHLLASLPGAVNVFSSDVEDTGGDWYACCHTVVF